MGPLDDLLSLLRSFGQQARHTTPTFAMQPWRQFAKQGYPEIGQDAMRLVHYTGPNVLDSILGSGFRFKNALDNTVHQFSPDSVDELADILLRQKVGPWEGSQFGRSAVLMDMPNDLYNSMFRYAQSGGVVPPSLIRGFWDQPSQLFMDNPGWSGQLPHGFTPPLQGYPARRRPTAPAQNYLPIPPSPPSIGDLDVW